MTDSLLSFKLLCFDCYGTIIDWETGIYERLTTLSSNDTSRSDLLNSFTKHEQAVQQAHPDLPYNEVLTKAYEAVATDLGVPATEEAAQAFGRSVGSWPAFRDSVAALQTLGRRFKLAPLSNVDNANLDASIKGPLSGVHFDARYTAQDIGSYKPDVRNFEYMIQKVKEDFGIEKSQILIVAQSLLHDHVPAKKIGLQSCWIMRAGDKAGMGGAISDYQDSVDPQWRVKTLDDLAELVEKENTSAVK